MVPTYEIDTSSNHTFMWHFQAGGQEIYIHPKTYPSYTGWEKELDPAFVKERLWNDKFIAEIPKWLKYLGDKWIYDAIQKQETSGVDTSVSNTTSSATNEMDPTLGPQLPAGVDLNMRQNNLMGMPGQHCIELYQSPKPPSLELCVRDPKPFFNATTWKINPSSNATVNWCTSESSDGRMFCFKQGQYPWKDWEKTFDEGYRKSQNWSDVFAQSYVPTYVNFINEQLIWDSPRNATTANSTWSYTRA